MKLQFTTLDVFTTTPFTGNPLAIVRVPTAHRAHLTEAQKQKIATEFNLSETVFLHEGSPSNDIVDYEIFTPRAPITFAGHPTIGTAIHLHTHPPWSPPPHTLRTTAGRIPFTINPSDEGHATIASVALPHALHLHAAALAHPLPSPTTPPTIPLFSIVRGMAFFLVPLGTLSALGSVSTGVLPVEEVFAGKHLDEGPWGEGLSGTFWYVDLGEEEAEGGSGRRRRLLRTRSIGTREDPGTGSASAALCCFLARGDAEVREGVFEFHLVQGVEMGRRCDVYVKVVVRRAVGGERVVEEVALRGSAVEVMEGLVNVE